MKYIPVDGAFHRRPLLQQWLRPGTHRVYGEARLSDELVVKVWRGREDGAFVAYRVPRRESQTVLDVVT